VNSCWNTIDRAIMRYIPEHGNHMWPETKKPRSRVVLYFLGSAYNFF